MSGEEFEYSWDFGEMNEANKRNEKLTTLLQSEALVNTSVFRENNRLTKVLEEIAKKALNKE